jgi:hypothetical protein
MRAVHKRYLREFLPAMTAYVVLILGSVWLLPQLQNTPLRVLATLVPVIPIVFVLRAMFRVIRDQDELERRIDLESIVAASAVVGLGSFTYGLLLSANVLPQPRAETVAVWILPALFACFGIAKCLVRLYYRGR